MKLVNLYVILVRCMPVSSRQIVTHASYNVTLTSIPLRVSNFNYCEISLCDFHSDKTWLLFHSTFWLWYLLTSRELVTS